MLALSYEVHIRSTAVALRYTTAQIQGLMHVRLTRNLHACCMRASLAANAGGPRFERVCVYGIRMGVC